ncbi:putative Ser/Thr protein kinase [Nocardiopsis mwathae]|uniref:Putative Ser/Thr protein kinase n=1 Tax=Nocardiopsis mwathae TaxID=1472723 RepID=A0A7W9YLC9_9ACTN|nr:serine/threonine-protein kinase [Nocardiopsis mwathae]MBB6173291.1 putative Ser/Thr protein kinase [Nocardiopsis mwathae]
MSGVALLTDEDPRRIGDYALTGRLGRGGQGVVYLGQGPDEVPVAVKTLHADALDVAGLREQLAEEVDLARRVARFCTAQVVDADLDADPPYVVSEYIEGSSLRATVRRDGPLSGAALERLAIGTLTAIAAIHRAGIVHRDFKPGNVLMGPDGPRVIDFGIARVLEGTAILTENVAGTPAYMAPEQITGGRLGPAVDLFAWGATIVYAANGTGPFGHDSLRAVLHRVCNEPAELGDLGGALRGIAERCLDKDPAVRPGAAETLMELLGIESVGAAPGTSAGAAVDDEEAAASAPDATAAVPLQTLAVGVVTAAGPEAQRRAAAEVHRSHPGVGPLPVDVSDPGTRDRSSERAPRSGAGGQAAPAAAPPGSHRAPGPYAGPMAPPGGPPSGPRPGPGPASGPQPGFVGRAAPSHYAPSGPYPPPGTGGQVPMRPGAPVWPGAPAGPHPRPPAHPSVPTGGHPSASGGRPPGRPVQGGPMPPSTGPHAVPYPGPHGPLPPPGAPPRPRHPVPSVPPRRVNVGLLLGVLGGVAVVAVLAGLLVVGLLNAAGTAY